MAGLIHPLEMKSIECDQLTEVFELKGGSWRIGMFSSLESAEREKERQVSSQVHRVRIDVDRGWLTPDYIEWAKSGKNFTIDRIEVR